MNDIARWWILSAIDSLQLKNGSGPFAPGLWYKHCHFIYWNQHQPEKNPSPIEARDFLRTRQFTQWIHLNFNWFLPKIRHIAMILPMKKETEQLEIWVSNFTPNWILRSPSMYDVSGFSLSFHFHILTSNFTGQYFGRLVPFSFIQ